MGLVVTLVPMPSGQLATAAVSGQLYCSDLLSWLADYPWVLDFLPTITPGGSWYAIQGFNLTMMGTLYQQAVAYSHSGDDAGLVRVSNQMTELANQEVMFLYTIYPEWFFVMTSSIHGYYYNPSEGMVPGYYFAMMY